MGQVIKKAKKLGSDEEKADYVYNYWVLQSLYFNQPQETDDNFSTLFTTILDMLKVPYSRAILTSWYNEPLDQLISYIDVSRAIMLKNGKCYFPLNNVVSANVIPSLYQNRDGMYTDRAKKFYKGPFTTFKTAGSKASDNVEKVTIDATITDGILNIKRQNTTTGCEKEGLISTYSTGEDLVKAWGKPYGATTSSDIYNYKESESKARATERAEKDKQVIPERFSKEIKAYHDRAAMKINATSVDNYAENNTPFVYTTDYQMDGLVKKAGRNLVVSVGQLFGQQTHIEGKDRKRDADLIFDFPRTYTVTMNLTIPSDYSITPESLQKLNNNIDNEYVNFTTKAQVRDGKLVINFDKVYKQQRIPAAKWAQILAMLDQAYEFTSQQVVLKKN